MLKAYKYRIYPSDSQKPMLAQAFGNARFVYNNSLAFKKEQYDKNKKSISSNKLIKRIPLLKSEHDFLKISPSQTLQMTLRNLDSAYQDFFKNKKGYPNFKSKYHKQTLQFPQSVKVDFKNSKIYIPKIGKVLSVLHRKFVGNIKTCTLSKTPADKYFISILVEDGNEVPIKKLIKTTDKVIGIDLGIKDFLTTSNGNKISNPKFLNKYLEKLKHYQRKFSLKKKGSNNRKKSKLKVAKIHERISNCRKDFLHKTSSKLINENQVIMIEDLNVESMMKDTFKSLARNIGDVSWSEFINILTYKAEWYGKYVFKVDPRNTSKMCSNCHEINKELTLDIRKWQCKHCHSIHDRDINAARNVLRIGKELPEYKKALNKENIKLSSFEIGN
jgi:putative transposase